MSRFLSLVPCSLALWLVAAPAVAAEPLRVAELRTQRVGETTYFTVSFRPPDDLIMPTFDRWDVSRVNAAQRRRLSYLPRLVPQDRRTSAVCFKLPESPTEVDPTILEFVGRVHGDEPARLLLLYPITKLLPPAWAETPVALDFSKATKVKPNRNPRAVPPSDNDLEGLWALAQARTFAALEAQTPEFGFYGFARTATGRRYDVATPALVKTADVPREEEYRRLYEMTTGATALTESLAMRRLLGNGGRDRGKRTVDVGRIPGIDIAEHPWERMMAGKKPAPEPLARLVPHDNYYVAFKNIRKFIELGELLDQWGTNVVRAFEINSRDVQLKERYEKQLCLRSSGLAKTLGPTIIRSVAITGNDFYLREGSDVSVLFQVNNKALFRAAVEPFLKAAREEFGDRLKESKRDYRDVTVESFVTPLREVSLHRAAFDDVIVYANSAAALERILDVHAGRRKSLAESLDFQYMRTVFERDDKSEDGFAFLSDAFIRQLVGPASKIKEKRRLEALTSLTLVTHGALFTAWETGHLPADHEALMAASRLKPSEIEMPEGEGAGWARKQEAAMSEVYNTMHFVTPLIELPLDKVTPQEERDYRAFREEYLGLWRRYFDPVSMRFSLTEKQVKVETYILPLIQSNGYNELRRMTGGRATTFDLNSVPSRALLQYLVRIDPDQWRFFGGNDKTPLGDWFFVRWDDSPLYRELLELYVRQQEDPRTDAEYEHEAARLFFQLPMILGVKIGNQKDFDDLLKEMTAAVRQWLGPVTVEYLKPYKGVKVTRVEFNPSVLLGTDLYGRDVPREKRRRPVYYHAQVEGVWYLSFSQEALRDQIDRVLALREGKGPGGKDKVEVSSSLYVAPEAMFSAGTAVSSYLEWETHRRALANEPLWYALYRGGLLADDASEVRRREVAMRYLGFVPVSPDGAAYRYERRTGEVANDRHGTVRRPHLNRALDEHSPLAGLLDQLRTIRVDLRFREDGVHTVLTMERKPAK
jgi:hypothetical protein